MTWRYRAPGKPAVYLMYRSGANIVCEAPVPIKVEKSERQRGLENIQDYTTRNPKEFYSTSSRKSRNTRGYSSHYPNSTMKEKRDVRFVERLIRKASRGFNKLSKERQAEFVAYVRRDEALQISIEQILLNVNPLQTYKSEPARKLAAFHQVIAEIESGKSHVADETIMAAFKFVKDFNITMYGDRLKRLVRAPQPDSQIIMNKGDGVFGYDEPLQVLAKLGGSSDYGSPTDDSPLYLFREAWDKVSFVKMQIREVQLYNGPGLPDIDFEKKWREETGEELFREDIDWRATFDKGCVWKAWCDGIHGKDRESRGILVLLMVVLVSNFMIAPDQKLEPSGGGLTKAQIEWISVYVKDEMPELVRLAEYLSPWAVKLYRKGYLRVEDQEGFDSGLDAILKDL